MVNTKSAMDRSYSLTLDALGEKVWGRGSIDDKSGLIAILYVAIVLGI
jgi:acetylornithine deacetylase/succinyl-diaminopimelate desuccinylase-like protein